MRHPLLFGFTGPVVIIISIAIMLGLQGGEPITLRYEAGITVDGDEGFVERVRGAFTLLAEDDTLAWWLIWASENDVTIRQSMDAALFWAPTIMTAHGSTMTVVVHPPGHLLDPTSLAVMIVHELRHLMQYTAQPDNPVYDEAAAWQDAVLAAEVLEWRWLEWTRMQYCQAAPQKC